MVSIAHDGFDRQSRAEIFIEQRRGALKTTLRGSMVAGRGWKPLLKRLPEQTSSTEFFHTSVETVRCGFAFASFAEGTLPEENGTPNTYLHLGGCSRKVSRFNPS